MNRNQGLEPNRDPTLERKDQKAPTFFTLDLNASYKINKHLKLGFRLENVFDYTQVKEGDSPSAWHWHFNHAHYDGLHTWGPNQGRQFYLTLSGNF